MKNLDENRAAKTKGENLEGNRAANREKYQLPLKHLKRVGIEMIPLSDWLNVLPRGRGTAGVTELPLPPKGMLWHIVLTLKSCACNICTA